jgi:hypothetical protein
VPIRRFRYDDPCEIQAIGRSTYAKGIRFHSQREGRWLIFWSNERNEILDTLDTFTDAVAKEPLPLNQFRPGPPP